MWIFIGVVAVSMASKYLIRWRGRHIFNPSNLGLVLAFVALGPQYTEPQDLWWIPMGPWMIVTYAILIGGGLFIGWELKLLGLELGYMAAFALFVALAFGWAGRCALGRLVAPLEEGRGPVGAVRGLGLRAPVALGVSLLLLAALPLSAEFSLHGTIPAPELPDGTRPTLALVIGPNSVDIGSWTVNAAGQALPPPGGTTPTQASSRVWFLPPIPPVTLPDNVTAFDSTITQTKADTWARQVVLDLMIESEARRAHDLTLASVGATGDGLTEFTDVIKQDIKAGKSVLKTYSFDRIQLTLFLPKLSTQASRLVGVSLHGTSTLITRDASGKVLSQQTQPYAKSWGLGGSSANPDPIINDYTDLSLA